MPVNHKLGINVPVPVLQHYYTMYTAEVDVGTMGEQEIKHEMNKLE